tara:strand:+ start:975 stop:1370 length:396 start_codon:yes stop_codon:yes gene_type:complete
MARRNYYNRGDWYSEWCRDVENRRIGFVDIDVCGICDKCWEPLYLAETCFDKGQTYKTTHTTERLATLAGLPSFLIFYKVEQNKIVRFRIKQLTPTKSEDFNYMFPSGWVGIMEMLQEQHDKICKKNKEHR